MKEIKAYIQRHLVNRAVEELERAGAPGITVVEIHPVGCGYEPNYFGFQSEDAFKRYAHLSVVKVEVVCADQDWERFARLIEDTCCTGGRGDGRIFVTDVVAAVRIRDGLVARQRFDGPRSDAAAMAVRPADLGQLPPDLGRQPAPARALDKLPNPMKTMTDRASWNRDPERGNVFAFVGGEP